MPAVALSGTTTCWTAGEPSVSTASSRVKSSLIEKPNVPSIESPAGTLGMSMSKLSRTGWPPDLSTIVASRRAVVLAEVLERRPDVEVGVAAVGLDGQVVEGDVEAREPGLLAEGRLDRLDRRLGLVVGRWIDEMSIPAPPTRSSIAVVDLRPGRRCRRPGRASGRSAAARGEDDGEGPGEHRGDERPAEADRVRGSASRISLVVREAGGSVQWWRSIWRQCRTRPCGSA